MEASINWKEGIPLFIRNIKGVVQDDTLALVTFPDLYVGLAYIGGGHVFLGAAVQGWKNGSLRRKCPNCSSSAYVLRAGGSPLSGTGSWSGICPKCGEVRATERVTGLALNPTIKGNWGPLEYRPLIQKGSPWRFDFKLGAVREGDLDEIRLPVLSWNQFISHYYPELLLSRDADREEEGSGVSGWGISFRGRPPVTFPLNTAEIDTNSHGEVDHDL